MPSGSDPLPAHARPIKAFVLACLAAVIALLLDPVLVWTVGPPFTGTPSAFAFFWVSRGSGNVAVLSSVLLCLLASRIHRRSAACSAALVSMATIPTLIGLVAAIWEILYVRYSVMGGEPLVAADRPMLYWVCICKIKTGLFCTAASLAVLAALFSRSEGNGGSGRQDGESTPRGIRIDDE